MARTLTREGTIGEELIKVQRGIDGQLGDRRELLIEWP